MGQAMREIVRTTVRAMAPPSRDQRRDAASRWGRPEAHEALQAVWPCMNSIEIGTARTQAAPAKDALTICAWNMERCKRVEDVAEVIKGCDADIVLATEMDWGMARSSQRHTTRDLAEALDMHYAFAVEFVELGIGDPFEVAQFAGTPNQHGLHGNAILSRWPLIKPAVLPLDEGGGWFVRAPKEDGQYRVGGRMALSAQIETEAGPLIVAAIHFESESDALDRHIQSDRLMLAVDSEYGLGPAVLGGDLNTAALTGAPASDVLDRPALMEPSFSAFAEAGFDWRCANTGLVTTRVAPGRVASYPLKRLDWLLTRKVEASAPFVRPAVSGAGDYLSDHELIGVQIRMVDIRRAAA